MNVCSILHKAENAYGRVAAIELVTHLGDIEALESGAELIEFFDSVIEISQDPPMLKLTLDFGLLVLVPVANFSVAESGNPSWGTVTSLRLDSIECSNDHDA